VPPISSWVTLAITDPQPIRVTELRGGSSQSAHGVSDQLTGSPTFTIDDLPEELDKYRPRELPDSTALIDFECFACPPATCVFVVIRKRVHNETHYSANFMILFAKCFCVLQLDVEEHAPVGAREGTVIRSILDGNATIETPTIAFDPYDRRWDGLVPLEDDPLARIRQLAARLRSSSRGLLQRARWSRSHHRRLREELPKEPSALS
jgi:hypothetical protein